MSDELNEKHRRIKSFVIRGGRMTLGQKRGLDRAWPLFGLDKEQGIFDAEAIFKNTHPLILEIGFGMGSSLASMAQAEPTLNFIGVEVHRPGVGAILARAEEYQLQNLRVYCEDANEVLDKCLLDSSLERVQLYFPDPWHKKKHNKRRLVQADFVQRIRRKLKPGGIFHMATDWQPYAEKMMEVMSEAEGYQNQAGDQCYAERPDYRPITKFEIRGKKLGHGVWDLLFERVK